jgi:hypothetical protein
MPVAVVSRIIDTPLAEYWRKGFERFSEIRKIPICESKHPRLSERLAG